MATQCNYIAETGCTGQNYRHTKTNQTNEKSVWGGFKRLAATIGEYAVEVYRYNNNPEPIFSNGGTRVLIRPDRIDLV